MGLAGIALALGSALVWGAGDFAGGVATRRANELQVLALAAASGVLMLVVAAILAGEGWPEARNIAWAAAAGLLGSAGLVCLYKGLSIGSAAVVAPTAAVITAAVPVIFTITTKGLPHAPQLLGFVLALAGIWLVARAPGKKSSAQGLRLAVAAGLGFGAFLTLIAQVDARLIFVPLAISRTITLAASVMLLMVRGIGVPGIRSQPLALAAGLADAGGNVLYLVARLFTRLDVAAVLSSMYPISTVVLSYLIDGERVTGPQWVGVGISLAAIALISA